MTAAAPTPAKERRRPLVALMCRTPIVGEALEEALSDVAVVRRLPGSMRDAAGLLHWLAPDAVVVDADEQAAEVTAFAHALSSTIVHVSVRNRRVRLFQQGAWVTVEATPVTAEAVRNILIGAMFGEGRASP